MADGTGNEIPQRIRYVKGELVILHPEECEPHATEPSGYLANAEWKTEMAKTHVQRQCKGCGLWAIWEPKQTGDGDG
jgi:hypothetical protein